MPEGPAGVPRPLAEADLVVQMYYPYEGLSLNEERLERGFNSIDSFPLETDNTFSVDVKKGDFSAEPVRDTVVEVTVSASHGRIRSLTQVGENRDVMTVDQDRIDTIKQKVNAELDRAPVMVTYTVK